MRHFAFPHFFSPSFPIVVFCLRLHICLSRLQTFALFDLFWIGEGAKEEEKRTKTKKIGFVTFAARFIHFCRKEIWFSLWNRTARTREWVSFRTTLSIAILPPNDMVWGFLPLFLLLKVASAMQLKFNYCTCIAVKMGQVNTFFVCLFTILHTKNYIAAFFRCNVETQMRNLIEKIEFLAENWTEIEKNQMKSTWLLFGRFGVDGGRFFLYRFFLFLKFGQIAYQNIICISQVWLHRSIKCELQCTV